VIVPFIVDELLVIFVAPVVVTVGITKETAVKFFGLTLLPVVSKSNQLPPGVFPLTIA